MSVVATENVAPRAVRRAKSTLKAVPKGNAEPRANAALKVSVAAMENAGVTVAVVAAVTETTIPEATMKTGLKAFLAAICMLLAAGSCDNPREQFSLIQEVSPEDLRMGLSFDLNMEEGYVYTTSVVCRTRILQGIGVVPSGEQCPPESGAGQRCRGDVKKARLQPRQPVGLASQCLL